MSEADQPAECPKCHAKQAKRQFSTFAAVGGAAAGEAMGCAKPGCGARTGFG